MVFAVVSASHRAKALWITAISPFFHVFRYFLNCVGPLYMAIKFFAFFFPTISTFGCFWSQWPTSLAVTSGREGVRTTSFKPWRPHRGSCRGATAIEENNGSRREQWLTSLTVWTVHSICTYMIFIYIYIDISLYLSIGLSFSIYFGWPTSLPVWSVQTTKAYILQIWYL